MTKGGWPSLVLGRTGDSNTGCKTTAVGRCLRCVPGAFVYSHMAHFSWTVSSIHLVFLMNKIICKQTQNSHYAQIVPWCISCVKITWNFKTNVIADLPVYGFFFLWRLLKRHFCIHYFLNFKLGLSFLGQILFNHDALLSLYFARFNC